MIFNVNYKKTTGLASGFLFNILYFPYNTNFPKRDTAQHRIKPHRVGRSIEKAVHFQLPVSFFIVRQVVEHGK